MNTTVDQYAASIVEKYRVIPDTTSTSHIAADEVLPLLKQWGKQYLLGLTLSGRMPRTRRLRWGRTWMC